MRSYHCTLDHISTCGTGVAAAQNADDHIDGLAELDRIAHLNSGRNRFEKSMQTCGRSDSALLLAANDSSVEWVAVPDVLVLAWLPLDKDPQAANKQHSSWRGGAIYRG